MVTHNAESASVRHCRGHFSVADPLHAALDYRDSDAEGASERGVEGHGERMVHSDGLREI